MTIFFGIYHFYYQYNFQIGSRNICILFLHPFDLHTPLVLLYFFSIKILDILMIFSLSLGFKYDTLVGLKHVL